MSKYSDKVARRQARQREESANVYTPQDLKLGISPQLFRRVIAKQPLRVVLPLTPDTVPVARQMAEESTVKRFSVGVSVFCIPYAMRLKMTVTYITPPRRARAPVASIVVGLCPRGRMKPLKRIWIKRGLVVNL